MRGQQSTTTYKSADVLVVGAGLSGLIAADSLTRAGISVAVLEARDRIGGRVYTVTTPDRRGAFDLGPTWYWTHQTNIIAMLKELGLDSFEQFEIGHGVFEQQTDVPPQRFAAGQQPLSLRITGGTIALINSIATNIGAEAIHLNQTVQEISSNGRGPMSVEVATDGSPTTWHANQVIVTLPPHLAATTITYSPAIPENVQQAMINTPTWMGEAMKVMLIYEEPFWRNHGLSGMGVSYSGPVQQFHDAAPAEERPAALFGWVPNHDPSRMLSVGERRTAVIAQASRLFGPQAAHSIHYDEVNWENEPYTTNASDSRRVIATMHPRYGHPLLQTPQMDGRLWWATTEAAQEQGGYLDGAIYIGRQVAAQIVGQHSR